MTETMSLCVWTRDERQNFTLLCSSFTSLFKVIFNNVQELKSRDTIQNYNDLKGRFTPKSNSVLLSSSLI